MSDLIPPEFYLGQNYPNPFKQRTTIKYCVSYKTKVRITIYNSDGEMINKLVDEVKEADTYEVEFSIKGGFASGGYPVSGIRHQESGISTFHKATVDRQNPVSILLFYQMKAGDYLSEKEMRLAR